MYGATTLEEIYTDKNIEILGKEYLVKYSCEVTESGKFFSAISVVLIEKTNEIENPICVFDMLYNDVVEFIKEDFENSEGTQELAKDAIRASNEE